MKNRCNRCSFFLYNRPCLFAVRLMVILLGCLLASQALAAPPVKASPLQDGLTGQQIITEAVIRHSGFPWIYEEQTLVLRNNTGQKNVRKLRKFSRIESDHIVKLMMVFDFPREVRGMTLTSVLGPEGDMENRIHLPALGRTFLTGKDRGNQFLGTDFSIEDLVEFVTRYQYFRKDDQVIDKVPYFVVEAFEKPGDWADDSQKKAPYRSAYGMRRLFVRKDIFFIVRTDYFDRGGRMIKQLTRHDVKKTDQDMWQAGMLLMVNKRLNHTTLIKTDQRILSRDLVPPEMFTQAWIDAYLHLRPEHRPEKDEGVDDNDAAEKNEK